MPSYRRTAVLLAALALLLGSAAPVAAQSPGTDRGPSTSLPKPDPAPAAVRRQQTTSTSSTSSSTTSSSSSSSGSSYRSSPTPSYTPSYTPSPAPSTTATQSTAPAKPAAAKRTAVHRTKPKATKKPARPVKRAATKPATKAKKPVAQPKKQAPVVVLPTASRAANVASTSGDSGWSLSDRAVLGLTFLLAIAAGIAVLLAHVAWKRIRRVWLGRHLGGPDPVDEPEQFEDMQRVLQPWLLTNEPNGSNGMSSGSYDTQANEDEPIAVATGDGPTRT